MEGRGREDETHMHEPGQWLASSAVMVTVTPSGPSTSKRVLSGISFCGRGRQSVSERLMTRSAERAARSAPEGSQAEDEETHDPVHAHPLATRARRTARDGRRPSRLDLAQVGELEPAPDAVPELVVPNAVGGLDRVEDELLGDGRRVDLAVEVGRVEACARVEVGSASARRQGVRGRGRARRSVPAMWSVWAWVKR